MNEIQRFQTSFSRAVYNQMRRDTKCPPVIAIKQSPAHFGWYVEMKDGSFSIEQIKAADVWEAKCKCIAGWQAKQKEKPE